MLDVDESAMDAAAEERLRAHELFYSVFGKTASCYEEACAFGEAFRRLVPRHGSACFFRSRTMRVDPIHFGKSAKAAFLCEDRMDHAALCIARNFADERARRDMYSFDEEKLYEEIRVRFGTDTKEGAALRIQQWKAAMNLLARSLFIARREGISETVWMGTF